MKFNYFFIVALLSIGFNAESKAQADKSDWQNGVPEACTSVTVGKDASFDGSVMTSHTDDSHRTRSWMDIVPAKKHKKGEMVPMYKRVAYDSLAMPSYQHIKIGEIPQVSYTYKYINTAYACMNEHQLGIGESTFGGREELQSDNGLIDCQRLCQLMLERCKTAREAIMMADSLTQLYGWNDYGEALTIADTKEVWHFEITGKGKGEKGAVWVAQRVPDDHISVNANASTIQGIDLSDKDNFMASKNIFQVAKAKGYWKEENEPFRYCYVYNPEGRRTFASRRREWRVLSLMAPSLNLDPNGEVFPFSVKPDKKVTLQKMVDIFKDYYEDTDFDMTKNLLVPDKDGKMVKSPLANPFMPYDENKLLRINGGWGELGERTIARWYTMYATIIQCREWLPDAIGGLVWLAQDNVATSIYVPIYCQDTDVAKPYKVPGRPNGYTTESAWWAFNRLGTLTAQRWGEMRHDVDNVWIPWQTELFDNQKKIEAEALSLYEKKPKRAIEFLTNYSIKWGDKVVKRAWKLGDELWTKYDEKF
ncbi:MAG: dipeptidase [Hyphomicrobiales bacterium]